MSNLTENEKCAQFASIAQIPVDRARHYLESYGWNFDAALTSFYDNEADEPKVSPPQSSNVRTGGHVKRMVADSDSDSDDSRAKEEGQAFFVGGSEHSGQQVLGPSKKKGSGSVIDNLLKAAREHGAEEVAASSSSDGSSKASRVAFGGSGSRLGDSSETTPAGGAQRRPPPSVVSDATPHEVNVTMKMWQNGFSVDDGPLRDYFDPENARFLANLQQGKVPPDLTAQYPGQLIDLNIEDRRQENFAEPKHGIKAFSGSGQRLGAPTPDVVSSTVAPPAASSSATSPTKPQPTKVAAVDGQPTTNIQIRLADGSTLTGQFSLCATVSDIRTFINDSRAQYATASYLLMTTFPRQELNDPAATLEKANLKNAVIVQKLLSK